MTMKHNQDGFLVGEPDESKEDQPEELLTNLVSGQNTSNKLLGSIRTDVSAIAKAIGSAHRTVVEPAGRGSGAHPRNGIAVSPGGRQSLAAQRTGFGMPNARAAVSPVGRDSRGKFVAGAGGQSGEGKKLLDRMGEMASAFKGAGSGADQMDPALTAMSEVKSVVEPLGRGMFALFGRNKEQKKERWYNRIWKTLTNIEKKPPGTTVVSGGEGGGGGGSFLGSLMGGRGGLLKGGLGMLKGAGGLLKRIPVLGALLAGGGALASIFGGDDPSKSADENRAEKYKGVGGSVGMGIGGVAGAALGSLLGPVGTVVGGYLGSMGGEIIGEKVGDWTKTLVDADIPGKISKSWDGFVASAKDRWEAMKGGADALWTDAKNLAQKGVDKAVDLGNKANETIKNTTGIDVKKSAAIVAEGAKTAAVATGEFVAENAPKLVPKSIRRMADMAGNAGSVLNAGIDAGMGPKELANFMGQNAHESGNFKQLQEGLSYSSVGRIKSTFKGNRALAGMTDEQIQGLVKNPEALANTVYGNRMGNTEAGDGYKFRGRGFMQLTGKDNYAQASKDLGIDLVNNPDQAADPAMAAKLSAWYWKKNVSSKGAGEDTVRSRRIVNGGLNGLADTNAKVADWNARLAGGYPAYSPPVMPSLATAKIPAAPDVQIPNPSTAKERPMEVSVRQPIGQEVSDRGIAQIAGGGIGRPRGWG
jgi:predicted chitinase